MLSQTSFTSNIPWQIEAAFLHLPLIINNKRYTRIIFARLIKYWFRFCLTISKRSPCFSLTKWIPSLTPKRPAFIWGFLEIISLRKSCTALSALRIYDIKDNTIINSAMKIVAINKNILIISYFVIYLNYKVFKRDWKYA